MEWEPTRAEGLARLQDFTPRAAKRYAASALDDLGPADRSNVSTLSPWLRCRLVSERQVAEAILGRHKLAAVARFIQALCWRTYWKGWLEMRPGVWADYRRNVDALADRLDDERDLNAAYQNAVQGSTGLAPFDAWARELVETGYLHNHARQWFASIWIYTLKLPWELGADFFFRHLIDGDAASNTGSWRRAGGLHTPGKTFLARAADINAHTHARFALMEDALAAAAPPLTSEPPPDPGPIPPAADAPEERFVVLLTEDDLDPFGVDPALHRANGLAGVVLDNARSPLATGEKAAAFASGAMDDVLARAGRDLGAAAKRFNNPTVGELARWARELRADIIVTPYAPVGPAGDALDAWESELEAAGVSLLRVRRTWDDAFWPHAKAGYFGLRRRIPEVFELLGLPVDDAAEAAFTGPLERGRTQSA